MNDYSYIGQQLESYRQELPEPEAEWPLKVRKGHKCIIQYLFDPCLSVSWMKKRCYINSHNFSARFAHFIGRKPKTYINHHRMNAAVRVLANPQFNEIMISQIAADVGILSVSTFTRSFKRHSGMTPAKWRENQ